MQEQCVSIVEAAARLSVHPGTVRRLVKSGRIQALQVGRRITIPISELGRLRVGRGVHGVERALDEHAKRFADWTADAVTVLPPRAPDGAGSP